MSTNSGDIALLPFDYLLFLAGTLLPSALLAWLSGFVVRKQATRWGLVDRPNSSHKGHAEPIPLGGGLAIALAVVLPLLVVQIAMMRLESGNGLFGWKMPQFVWDHASGFVAQTQKLWTILLAALAMMLLGAADDARGLHWSIRIVAQIFIAGVVVWINDWGLTLFLPGKLAAMTVSILWIVALVNAFNMLDNMDGLSAGVAALCAAALATVLFVAPDPQTGQPQLFVIGFLLVLIGSLVGFLAHNSPPAKLFMGDAGSYFIGFCLAILTMQATYTDYHSGHPHAVLAPLCIMAVPLYDMLSVVAIRLWHRESPFHADRRHFSHRLVDAGFTKTQAVAIIYGITAATGIAALFLHRVNTMGAIAIFAVVGCSLLLLAVVERAARLRHRSRRED